RRGIQLDGRLGEQPRVVDDAARGRDLGQAGERGGVGAVLLARGGPLVGRGVEEAPAQVEPGQRPAALARGQPVDAVGERQDGGERVDVLGAQQRLEHGQQQRQRGALERRVGRRGAVGDGRPACEQLALVGGCAGALGALQRGGGRGAVAARDRGQRLRDRGGRGERGAVGDSGGGRAGLGRAAL